MPEVPVLPTQGFPKRSSTQPETLAHLCVTPTSLISAPQRIAARTELEKKKNKEFLRPFPLGHSPGNHGAARGDEFLPAPAPQQPLPQHNLFGHRGQTQSSSQTAPGPSASTLASRDTGRASAAG